MLQELENIRGIILLCSDVINSNGLMKFRRIVLVLRQEEQEIRNSLINSPPPENHDIDAFRTRLNLLLRKATKLSRFVLKVNHDIMTFMHEYTVEFGPVWSGWATHKIRKHHVILVQFRFLFFPSSSLQFVLCFYAISPFSIVISFFCSFFCSKEAQTECILCSSSQNKYNL